MSSGVPKRTRGIVTRNLVRVSGASAPMNVASSGVSLATGLSALTRIPRRVDQPGSGGSGSGQAIDDHAGVVPADHLGGRGTLRVVPLRRPRAHAQEYVEEHVGRQLGVEHAALTTTVDDTDQQLLVLEAPSPHGVVDILGKRRELAYEQRHAGFVIDHIPEDHNDGLGEGLRRCQALLDDGGDVADLQVDETVVNRLDEMGLRFEMVIEGALGHAGATSDIQNGRAGEALGRIQIDGRPQQPFTSLNPVLYTGHSIPFHSYARPTAYRPGGRCPVNHVLDRRELTSSV